MKGTVKFFNNSKGFGFIKGEDGTEYFVHHSGLNAGITLNENDSESLKHSRAKEARRLSR